MASAEREVAKILALIGINSMKRTIRLTALLGLGFLLGACTEDDIIKNYGPKDCVGDEIVFGVSTASDTKTRTVYGDASASEKQVEVNWVKGDMLMIACPQAAGTSLAHYQVTAEKEMDQTPDSLGGYSETSIQRAEGEDASLQWGAGDGENGLHDFYAVYPSSKKPGMSPTEDGDKPYVTMNDDGFVGYLPLDQSVPAASVVEKDGNFIVNPNMDIAYMVAKTLDVTRGGAVELEFGSLNTVLQFQIHRGDIVDNITVGDIKIHGASLFSASGKAICGSFNYKFADGSCTSQAAVASDYRRVTITLPEAKKLTENNYCDLTFFILPTYENEDITVGDDNDGIDEMNDLQLQVMYSVGGSPQLKTATIKADIQASTKHLFKNVKLPKIESGVTGSNWFNGLADDIYISQLSIPVAGNAFSNGSEAAYKEQTKSYTDLWNLGVRGFEICTYNVGNDTTTSIGNAPIISGGADVGIDVSEAFEELYSKLGDETLVLVFTPRHAPNQGFGSFAPNVFVKQIETYLDAFIKQESIANKGDLFVKLSSGSCVGDLKGKIAIVVRPGDNDFITSSEVSKATVSEEWYDYLTVIDDWGTAEDQWGDRYGAYFDQAGYNTANTGKSVFENQFLKYRVDTKSWYSWSNGTKSGSYPASVAAADKNYKRLINGNESDIAYVQCWERVVQAETDYKEVAMNGGSLNPSGNRLNIKWFESYNEKKAMAQYIAEQAASQKGKTQSPLYINSLCGFFIDYNTAFSYMPNLNKTSFGNYSFTPDKDGTGGDFKSCAANLNYWFYNLLSNDSINQGPYGLVMLDYIGATATELSDFVTKETGITAALAAEACQNLPLLIMMNNFTFPLATNPDYGKTTPAEASMTISQDMVDPSKPVYVKWRK